MPKLKRYEMPCAIPVKAYLVVEATNFSEVIRKLQKSPTAWKEYVVILEESISDLELGNGIPYPVPNSAAGLITVIDPETGEYVYDEGTLSFMELKRIPEEFDTKLRSLTDD
jgi:hypothetical protein